MRRRPWGRDTVATKEFVSESALAGTRWSAQRDERSTRKDQILISHVDPNLSVLCVRDAMR